jgi:hypothetical protein
LVLSQEMIHLQLLSPDEGLVLIKLPSTLNFSFYLPLVLLLSLPIVTLVLVYMIVSEVIMFLKKMNETNSLIFVNFVLENTHKYHANYSINILKF